MSILKQIENYHIIAEKKIIKILNPKINYVVKYDKDNYDILLIFNKDNNNLLMTVKYQYIGIYNIAKRKFYWGWELIKDKRLIENVSKIKNLKKNKKCKKIHKYISSDIINIANKQMLNTIIHLAFYLMKAEWYFELVINDNLIQYITIQDILEKYI